MATKTYQANSMMEALKMVQGEMGPEAIVVSVRDIPLGPPWQVWKRTGVEVVAMTPDTLTRAAEEKGEKSSSRPEPVIRPSANGKGIEFIENAPEIEWEDSNAPGAKKEAGNGQAKLPAGAPADKKGSAWQPQVIQKPVVQKEKEVAVNRAALFRGDTAAANISPARDLPEIEPLAMKTAPAQNPEPVARYSVPAQNPAPLEKKAFPAQTPAGQPALLPEALAQLQRRLLQQGLEKDFVDWLVKLAGDVLPPSALKDQDQCRAYFSRQLEAELIVQPKNSLDGTNQAIVLVGPSGSGKTSTVAKLAFYYQNVLKKSVAWVTADTVRTGAIAETRSFTDAIGVPLWLVYTPDDLTTAFEANQDADIILIDTPGYNLYSEAQLVDLGEILTKIPNRLTYLVASATTKDSDLNQAAASLGYYSLKGLILTKLDETLAFGSVYNLGRNSKLPLAFFCTGKEASGNLQNAEAGRLVSALFGKGWVK